MSDPQPGGQPIGDVAKDVIDKDPSNGRGRPGKSSTAVTVLKKPVTLISLGVLGAAAVGIGVTAAVSGGGATTTTPTTQAPPTTAVAAGSTTTTATVVATPPPPALKPIDAVFTQSLFHTVYTEDATPGTLGQTLTYTWSVSIPADPGCASGFRGNTPQQNQATWYHADTSQGGPCNHSGQDYGASGHPGTVTVVVTSGLWRCTATISGTITQPGGTPQPCAHS